MRVYIRDGFLTWVWWVASLIACVRTCEFFDLGTVGRFM